MSSIMRAAKRAKERRDVRLKRRHGSNAEKCQRCGRQPAATLITWRAGKRVHGCRTCIFGDYTC